MGFYQAYPSVTAPGSSAPASPRDRRGSMGLALAGGTGAAIAGSVVWALIAYLTKHQFSLIAVLVGIAVGFAVSRSRRGDPAAAVAGAVLALLGCALGTFLALIFARVRDGAGLAAVLGHLTLIAHEYPGSVGALGILFWVIAAVIGFKYTMGLPSGRSRQALPDARPRGSEHAYRAPAASRPAPGGYGTPQAPTSAWDEGSPLAPDQYLPPEPAATRNRPPWEAQPAPAATSEIPAPQFARSVTGQIRAVPPVTGQIRAVPPVTGQSRAVRPVTGQIPAVRPVTGQIPAVPPVTGQIPAVPPVTGQIPAVPPVTGRSRAVPPVTGQVWTPGAAEQRAVAKSGPPSAQLPAVTARHRAPQPGTGRHGAPEAAAAEPPPAQPTGGRGDGGQGSGLPKRQRPSGRHSRPLAGPGA
jgi:hypothetical protein